MSETSKHDIEGSASSMSLDIPDLAKLVDAGINGSEEFGLVSGIVTASLLGMLASSGMSPPMSRDWQATVKSDSKPMHLVYLVTCALANTTVYAQWAEHEDKTVVQLTDEGYVLARKLASLSAMVSESVLAALKEGGEQEEA